jgi:predicted unusual protein kinase regulating ubiquinone biosynthesis (AarF/ABC1/UbiB family)|tara:strand:+ start:1070 stop:2410 length:1341 start_codon:yes stop_codon:yes gene_type:complete
VANEKDDKRFKATTPGKRFLKLAGMSASIAKNVASHKVKGLFRDDAAHAQSQEQLYSDIGRQIAQTLGEMKGAVMKVGQIASQVKDMLPDEVASALEVLQKESPPMPYPMIRRQLIKALGDTPENLFAHFDETPFAAASIGQVHRALTKEGEECVVKIQYPGVKESCDSDLKHLKRALKLAGLVKVSPEVIDQTFEEIRRMLYEELDYVHEAENIKLFRDYYQNHPYIIMPELIESLSSETVLTLTYVEGDPLQKVKEPEYSQDTINLIGYRIFETFGRQIYDLRAVHSDPHPGNFAFRPDGRIVLYDFGAVKRIPEETIDKLRKLVSDAIAGNVDTLDEHLLAIGVRQLGGKEPDHEFYNEWLDIFMAPFRDYEAFDFSESNLHKRIMGKFKRDGLKYIGSFQPSPETMHVDRVISGHYWTMVDLGVKVSFRPLVDEIVLRKAAA